MKKAKKVGTLVKPATTILPNYIRSKRKKPTQLGADGERIEVEKHGPRQGLEVNYNIKVWRVTQVPEEFNGKDVHILYGNGRDKKKISGKQMKSDTTVIEGRIGLWEKDAPPYEIDVTLEPIEVEDKDEIPWEIHPAVFSLRTPHRITAEDEREIEAKREMKRAKIERRRRRLEKKGRTEEEEKKRQKDKKKKKEKKKKKVGEEEEESDEEEDDNSDNEDENGEYVLEDMYKWDVIGSRVQLDLSEYMEHGLNITEAYGVPTARPKKQKKRVRTKDQKEEDKKLKKEEKKKHRKEKKEKKKRGEDSDDEEEEEEEDDFVPTMCYKLVVTIQAQWQKYFGRRITNDVSVDGERVTIDGQEWVYLDDPIEDEEEMGGKQPKKKAPPVAAIAHEDDSFGEEEAAGKVSLLQKAKMKREQLKQSKKMKKEESTNQKEYLKQQARLAKQAEAEAAEEKKQEAVRAQEMQRSEFERRRQEEEIDRMAQEDRADDMDIAKRLEKERLRREKEEKKKKGDSKLKKSKSRGSKASLLDSKIDKKKRTEEEASKKKNKKKSSDEHKDDGKAEAKQHSRSSSKTSSEHEKDLKSSRKSSVSEEVEASPGRKRKELLASSTVGSAVSLNKSIVKKKTKMDIRITVLEVVCSDRHNGKMIYFAWKRGLKKENSGESCRVLCENSRAEFPLDGAANSMRMSCTFVQAQRSNEYEVKNVAISLKEEKGKKSTQFGKALVDLAEYAVDGFKREVSIPIIVQSKGETASLLARIETSQSSSASSTPNVAKRLPLSAPGGSSKKKKRVKVRYEIALVKLEQLPSSVSKGSAVLVTWARGSKAQNVGKSPSVTYEQGAATWPLGAKPILLECSMMQSTKSNVFSSKKLSLSVVRTSKGKEKTVGKVAVNLADYDKHGMDVQCKWTLKSRSGGAGVLTAQLRSTWLSFDGKKVSEEAPSHTGSSAIIGKPETVSVGDKELYLEEQSPDEQSVIDDATQMSDDLMTETEGGDSDDEDSSESGGMVSAPPRVFDSQASSSTRSPGSISFQDSDSEEEDSSDGFVAAPPRVVISEASEEKEKREEAVASSPAGEARTDKRVVELEKELRSMKKENSKLKKASAATATASKDDDFDENEKAELLQVNEELANAVETLRGQLLKAKEALESVQPREAALKQQAEKERQAREQAQQMVARFEQQLQDLKKAASGKGSKSKSKGDVAQLTQIHEQEKQMLQEQLSQAQASVAEAEKKTAAASAAAQSAKKDAEKYKKKAKSAQKKADAAAVASQSAAAVGTARSGPKEGSSGVESFVALLMANEPELDERLGGYKMGHQAAIQLAQDWRPSTAQAILQGIANGSRLAGADYPMLSYWLSVATTALWDLQQHPSLGLSGDLREEGVQEGNVDLEHSDELSPEDAEDALKATVNVTFNRLVRGASKELDRVVRYSFIEGSSAILEIGGKSQLADPSKSIFRVTEILERVLSSLLEADVTDIVIAQCFRKLLYHISASLFNAIVSDASLCSAKTGFRVKMGISFLDSWVTEQNKKYEGVLGTAGRELEICKQGANVLCMATNRSVFNSVDSVKEMFSPLSMAQIRKLLSMFSPDSFAPEPVPEAVKSLMASAGGGGQVLVATELDLSQEQPRTFVPAPAPEEDARAVASSVGDDYDHQSDYGDDSKEEEGVEVIQEEAFPEDLFGGRSPRPKQAESDDDDYESDDHDQAAKPSAGWGAQVAYSDDDEDDDDDDDDDDDHNGASPQVHRQAQRPSFQDSDDDDDEDSDEGGNYGYSGFSNY